VLSGSGTPRETGNDVFSRAAWEDGSFPSRSQVSTRLAASHLVALGRPERPNGVSAV
jgi:hypothetical protein